MFSSGVVASPCETLAQPVSDFVPGKPFQGLEVAVNPRLTVVLPDGPSRIVHNNVVIILDYADGVRIAFREVARPELEPEIGDTPMSRFLEWAFQTPNDELPATQASRFAKDYARGLCAQELVYLRRGKLIIYAGVQEGGVRFAIIANQGDDHGFMHLSTRDVDASMFERLLKSIGTR